ncbi:hypothetical protein SMC26_24190 [Actinomadura fulvescens]|uniref:Uncharacterized protein n=1 Tax=Actinomadura fulvescens TaxID=46160 RepID=A0ABN3Q581_9ACTN
MTNPTTPNRPVVPGDLFARHQIINGLVDLAAFLEANPQVPVDEYGENFTVYVRNDCDAAARTEVDRLAALLGVPVEDDTARDGHYTATKRFGRIRYRVVHIPTRAKQRHDAVYSYARNIQVDGPAEGRAA